MKKLKLLVLGVMLAAMIIMLPGIVKADNVTTPNFFKRIGSAVSFLNSTWSLGSSSARIAKGWFTDVDISGTVSLGGSIGYGNMDLNGNDIVNVDNISGVTTNPVTIGSQLNMDGNKLVGSSSADGNLWLTPTSNATKGRIVFGDLNTSSYVGSTDQWGFRTLTPTTGALATFAGTVGNVNVMDSGRLVVGEDILGVNRPALSVVMPSTGYGGSFKNVMLMGGYSSDITNVYNNINFGLIQLTNTANNYAMYTAYNANKIDVTYFGTRITNHGTLGSNKGDFLISTANNALPSTSFITTSEKKTAIGYLQTTPGSTNIEPTAGLNIVDPSDNGLLTLSGKGTANGVTSAFELGYNKAVGTGTANLAKILSTKQSLGGGNLELQVAPDATSYTTGLSISTYGDIDIPIGTLTLHDKSIFGVGADIQGTQNQKLTMSVPSQGSSSNNDGKGILLLGDDGGSLSTGGDGGNIELRGGSGQGTDPNVGGSVFLRTGLGVTSNNYGASVLTDGEFDVWTNPTTLTNWTTFDAVGTNGTIDQESTIVYSGTSAVKLGNVGGDFKLIYETVSGLTTSDVYRLKFWVRGSVGSEVGQLLILNDGPISATEVWNWTTKTWVAWTGTPPVNENIPMTNSYAEYTAPDNIPVPANGKITVCLIADGDTSGNIVYYDLVSLQKVTTVSGTNGSIVFLVGNDASMYIDMLPGTRTPVIYGAGPTTGDSSVAMVFGSDEDYTAGKLLSVRNHIGSSWGTEKFFIDYQGSYQGTGRQLGLQGSDVTAANDMTLGLGNYYDITGATEMQRILGTGWTAGTVVTLQFDGAPLVKNGTAAGSSYYGFKLAGGADFQASADDTLTLVFDGSWWRETSRSAN